MTDHRSPALAGVFSIFAVAVWTTMLTGFALAETPSPPAGPAGGHDLLAEHCGRCHAIGASGGSPLEAAPPLRDIFNQRSPEWLAADLSEGLGSRHDDMPQVQFSSDEIGAILDYLGSITLPQQQR